MRINYRRRRPRSEKPLHFKIGISLPPPPPPPPRISSTEAAFLEKEIKNVNETDFLGSYANLGKRAASPPFL
jgi:hypothetical protein